MQLFFVVEIGVEKMDKNTIDLEIRLGNIECIIIVGMIGCEISSVVVGVLRAVIGKIFYSEEEKL